MGRNSHYFKGKEENAKKALGIYESIEHDKEMMWFVNWCVENSSIYSPSDTDNLTNYIRSDKPLYMKPDKNIANLDTVSAIEKIYENGITFWTKDENGFHVGDYSLDNSPVQNVPKESKT